MSTIGAPGAVLFCFLGILFILITGATSPAREEEGEKGPYLVWEFICRPDPESGYPYYYHDAVTLMMASGKQSWRAKLPARMRQYQAGIGEAEIRAIRDYPRQAATHISHLCGVLYLRNSVVIGDSSGLLALDLKEGKTLLDYSDERRDNGEFLFFDSGTYEIKSPGGQIWSGAAKRGTFLAACDQRLVYFNGRIMAVFTIAQWKLSRELLYRASLHRLPSSPARVLARFHIDEMQVLLDGIVYLKVNIH